MPRVLAGLLVPIAGILLLTFYLADRPAEADAGGRTPTARGGTSLDRPAIPTKAPSLATGSPSVANTPTTDPATVEPPAAEPTPTAPPTVTPTGLTQGRVNADEGLNIRSGPSTNFGVVRVAPFGELVELTGESTAEGDLLWVELVEDGWVQDQYLDFE